MKVYRCASKRPTEMKAINKRPERGITLMQAYTALSENRRRYYYYLSIGDEKKVHKYKCRVMKYTDIVHSMI